MGETIPKQETIVKQQPKPEERIDSGAVTAVLTPANVVPNSGESKLPPSKIDAEMLLKSWDIYMAWLRFLDWLSELIFIFIVFLFYW